MSLNKLIEILHKEACSLVMEDLQGRVHLYYKKGVRDLEDLLDNNQELLRGAIVADKIIGKAAAGMLAYGGVSEVYGEITSKKAVPILEGSGIKYSYGKLVDHIIIPEGDTRCPLEQLVSAANTPSDIVKTLRKHFREMRSSRQ